MVEYEDEKTRRVLYLLIIGSTQIPLARTLPVLKVDQTHYIVPYPADHRYNYGIEIPAYTDAGVLRDFERLMSAFTDFRLSTAEQLRVKEKAPRSRSEPPHNRTLTPEDQKSVALASHPTVKKADKVSNGIKQGASIVAEGIFRGSLYVGRGLRDGAQFLKEKIVPNKKKTTVSRATENRIRQAQLVTGAMVQVSKSVVAGAMAAVESLGTAASDVVRDSDAYKEAQEKSGPKTEAAKKIAKSTITGFRTYIWCGLWML